MAEGRQRTIRLSNNKGGAPARAPPERLDSTFTPDGHYWIGNRGSDDVHADDTTHRHSGQRAQVSSTIEPGQCVLCGHRLPGHHPNCLDAKPVQVLPPARHKKRRLDHED